MSNNITKSVAILCSATLWLYAMWIYANVEMNGWQSGWVFTMAAVGTIGIMVIVAMNLGQKPIDPKNGKGRK